MGLPKKGPLAGDGRQFEVGVVYESNDAAARGRHRGGDNAVAHVGRGTVLERPGLDGGGDRLADVIDSPVREGAGGGGSVGQQTELVAARVEPHVEGLVEIWWRAEKGGPPRFGGLQIGSRINHCSKSE